MANNSVGVPPAPMKMTGNLALEWRKFRGQYEIYETASDVDEKL